MPHAVTIMMHCGTGLLPIPPPNSPTPRSTWSRTWKVKHTERRILDGRFAMAARTLPPRAPLQMATDRGKITEEPTFAQSGDDPASFNSYVGTAPHLARG